MKTIIGVILLSITLSSPVLGVVIDSVNGNESPFGLNWGCEEIGWLYTPQFSYTLTGVLTRLGFEKIDETDFRIVTLEIYDGLPVNGGALLRSATFSVVDYDFAGGSFAPLEISVNKDYFIGFRNVQLLRINVADAGIELTTYSDFDNDGTYSNLITPPHIATHPILRFEGVPEPATIVLLSLGGLLLCGRKG